MEVILSRKGFDETSGGAASPIYDGKFIPFPIPRADSDVFYKDLVFSESLSSLQVMKDLGIKQYSEAHLDPDLTRSVHRNRHPDWRPAFGQSEIAQSTLAKHVSRGDLFLFFGWYKNIHSGSRSTRRSRKRIDSNSNSLLKKSRHSLDGSFRR